MKPNSLLFVGLIVLTSFSTFSQSSYNGQWRAALQIRPDLSVPFNFEIKHSGDGNKAFFINGSEHFETGIPLITKDSVFIPIDQFDNEIAFGRNGDSLIGVLRRQDRSGSTTIVRAAKANYRFRTNAKPAGNISGTYDIIFHGENSADSTVGLFKQDGNKLHATFLRVTGDSRFLEGVVDGNTFYLSSFIGSGIGYYKGTFENDGTIKGEIIGSRGSQAFDGKKNPNAALPDAYSLTNLKPGYTSFDFNLPDLDSNMISLKDAAYQNKVVILTITGTWCPNCIDETMFLSPWYKKNHDRGVEAIAIHYERKLDAAFLRKQINRFRDKYDIQYASVVGGVADKKQVAASLPALNTFLAFPTIIFIDKKGRVARIHTGYSGPATGKYYDEFVKEFNAEVDKLLSE